MKTIVIIDKRCGEIDIIHQVPEQNDYDVYVSCTLNYDLDSIHYMVLDEGAIIIPNHYTPKDFC